MLDCDGNDVLDHKEWLRLFGEAVDEVREEMRSKGRGGEFVGAKVADLICSCA